MAVSILYRQKGCKVAINSDTKSIKLEIGVRSDIRVGSLGFVRGEIKSLAESASITLVPAQGFACGRPDSFLDLVEHHPPPFQGHFAVSNSFQHTDSIQPI